METRRDFIKKSVVVCAALSLPLPWAANAQTVQREFKTRDPKRALVVSYSQSGFSARYGKLIACLLKDQGLTVEWADMRRFDPKRLPDYDLILVGSPVFYYDIPENVADWLSSAPKLTGIPVAAFVSFGGPEGNQHNALCHALHLLAEKEAVPVGMEAFRSIPAYPASWDSANQRSGEHLPDEATYNRVREFAKQIQERVRQGQSLAYSSEIALREIVRMLPLVWLNKKAVGKHTVDGAKCIGCRTCVKMCPVDAIHPERQFVDHDKCIACFGCLNNCPADAVVVEYRGNRLYGFPEYLKRRKITILEPPEFQHCKL
ncbi:MAG: EFR1 family ferrodoxin [Smithellaceae bacterium]|jgi:ferredoxin/flavodoxin|nr:EFR1 family ferrodoxin [Smithellaceae bacterium]MDD3259211.1 EFR1 family ferrodoxin [Smithellaceae bacterium]MDD3849903.1 EFR1 family ferrodoxin [Smithellaceae bacterium]HOG12469.1 EFR1 family ferrodoxin [Smithellaceae bacterium]HOQ72415.1 EFR1 family ferrodoxin [Smithellaceae bacterium]